MLRTSRPASAALTPTRLADSTSFRLLSPTSLRNSIATAPSFRAASTSSSGVSDGETIWLKPNFTWRCVMCISLKWIRIRRETPRATFDWASAVKGRARRRAIAELDVFRSNHPDHVDGRMQRLAPVLRMRFDVELDPLLLEHRHELLHR